MHNTSHFKIKNIHWTDPRTCELYIEDVETSLVQGWVINCDGVFVHQFHEHLNNLCHSEDPWRTLLYLKQFHQVDALS
ncbi:hypothetical protein [Acinetobacter puyangensis]|uniref:hypothetical protein n=1 Tax=Acinetobacter puyangensis TaxID=1096779 RepID=UPI003A4D5BB3